MNSALKLVEMARDGHGGAAADLARALDADVAKLLTCVEQCVAPREAPYLTSEHILEFVEVMGKASPGPWRMRRTQTLDQDGKDALTKCHGPVDFLAFVSTGEDESAGVAKTVAMSGDGPTSLANAEFIALAREAFPYLVAEVFRLRAALAGHEIERQGIPK